MDRCWTVVQDISFKNVAHITKVICMTSLVSVYVFEMHFLDKKCVLFCTISLNCVPNYLISNMSIGSVNGLVSIRGQAITCTKKYPAHWCMYGRHFSRLTNNWNRFPSSFPHVSPLLGPVLQFVVEWGTMWCATNQLVSEERLSFSNHLTAACRVQIGNGGMVLTGDM